MKIGKSKLSSQHIIHCNLLRPTIIFDYPVHTFLSEWHFPPPTKIYIFYKSTPPLQSKQNFLPTTFIIHQIFQKYHFLTWRGLGNSDFSAPGLNHWSRFDQRPYQRFLANTSLTNASSDFRMSSATPKDPRYVL